MNLTLRPVLMFICLQMIVAVSSNEFDWRSSSTNCRVKKCKSYYKGWWATTCNAPSRTLYKCSKTGDSCCVPACRIQSGCTARGGHCVSNVNHCDGTVYDKLCKGIRCFCCVPNLDTTTTTADTTTTTADSTTTTADSTTTTADSTTTTADSTTTIADSTTTIADSTTTIADSTTTIADSTTTIADSTTTIADSTTTIADSTTTDMDETTTTTAFETSTTTYGSSATTTLEPCSLTGEAGVSCTGPSGCDDLAPGDVDGVYQICPFSNCPSIDIYCTNDGWTVILKRDVNASPRCDFQVTWDEYKDGFCSDKDEFWLGNDIIHMLTGGSTSYKMEMYGVINETNTRTLAYDSFSVGSESTNYELSVDGYNASASTATDLFINPPITTISLDGMSFSTMDRDNDNLAGQNCSATQGDSGGWWFNDCTPVKATHNRVILWYFWDGPTDYYPLGEKKTLDELTIRIKPH